MRAPVWPWGRPGARELAYGSAKDEFASKGVINNTARLQIPLGDTMLRDTSKSHIAVLGDFTPKEQEKESAASHIILSPVSNDLRAKINESLHLID